LYGSNGDGLVGAVEATTFLAYAISIGNFTERLTKKINPRCHAGIGEDILGQPWLDADCFREEFFGKYYEYLEKYPELVPYLNEHSPEERWKLFAQLENAGRDDGVTQKPIGMGDISNMTGALHYIQSVFQRFDRNNSGRVSLSEVNAGFPQFRNLLKELAGNQPDWILRNALTFLVKKGRAPDPKKFGDMAELFAWAAWPFKKIDAGQERLFSVFSSISSTLREQQ